MKLSDLTRALEGLVRHARGPADREVTAIEWDSRRVMPGALFVAQRGWELDGHSFIEEAGRRGACVFVVEEGRPLAWPRETTVLEVRDTREALALLAAAWFGHPARSLELAAVTGTNGKSTTTALLAHLAAGKAPSGWIGTLGAFAPDFRAPASMTTPDVVPLHRLLAELASRGVRYVALEASSHGIEQRRLCGIRFHAAAFLNLTQDHLDYHGTLERYYEAKRSLFLGEPAPRVSVIHVDDPYGARLAEEVGRRGASELVTVGTRADANLVLERVAWDRSGLAVQFKFRKKRFSVLSPLSGLYNATNLSVAFAAAHVGFGLETRMLLARLAAFGGIAGRMERVACGQPFDVFIDYAHTPDAIERVLASVRLWTSGRIIVVFGCGGNRDAAKRPLMGRVTAAQADRIVLTSDNPRWEDRDAILEDILRGIGPEEVQRKVLVEPDRRLAIEQALRLAEPPDCVLILGKGHEEEQIIRDTRVAFSDREVARAILESKFQALPRDSGVSPG